MLVITSCKRIFLPLLLVLFSIKAVAQPAITSLSVYSGVPGTTVTINGSGFNATAANNVVYFGAAKATVNTASSTALNVTVPNGATYDVVTATDLATGRTGYSSKYFLPSVSASGSYTYVEGSIPITIPGGYLAVGISVYDLDGDGKNEIITATYNDIVIQKNNSTPSALSFDSVKIHCSYPESIIVADIDGDGKKDIVAMRSFTATIFKNNSTTGTLDSNSFAPGVDFTPGSLALPQLIIDVDGDGRPDIVGFSTTGSLSVLRNITSAGVINDSSFATAVSFSYPGIQQVYSGDVDGDGKPDIVTNNSGSSGALSIIRNTSTAGSISFAARVDLTIPGSAFWGIEFVDVDSSGTLDIVGNRSDDGNITVVENLCTPGTITAGLFANHYDYYQGELHQPDLPLVRDHNCDGRPDLVSITRGDLYYNVLTNRSKTTGVINNMTFSQSDWRQDEFWYGIMGLGVGDVNNDGAADLIFVNPYTNALVIKTGSGFAPYTDAHHMCRGSIEELYPATYTSNDTSIALISGGNMTGQNAGTTMITFTCDGGTCGHNTYAVTVDTPVIGPIAGTATMCVGATSSLSHTSAGGTWSSSNTGVATVGTNGVVTGVADGTATITYNTGVGCTPTKTVTVGVFGGAGTITGAIAICIATTATMASSVSGGTWSSSNEAVATIGTNGVLNGLSAGTTTISYSVAVTCGTALTTTTMVVDTTPSGGYFTGETVYSTGGAIWLTSSVDGGTWSSSDPAVAEIPSPLGGGGWALSTGTTIISHTVSNSCGTATSTVLVTVDPRLLTCSEWSDVGAGNFAPGTPAYCRIATDSSGRPYVVTTDGSDSSRVIVKMFNGTSWVNVGAPPGRGGGVTIAVTPGGTPYVCYGDLVGSADHVVKKYDGSNWVNVGIADSLGLGTSIKMTLDGNGRPTVLFNRLGDSKATVKQYNGVQWVTLGAAGFSVANMVALDIAYDRSGTLYVLYGENSPWMYGTVMKYDGTSWVNVGPTGFTGEGISDATLKIAPNGTPYVAYSDWSGNPHLKKFNGSAWEDMSPPYNPVHFMYGQALAIDNSNNIYMYYASVAYSDVRKLVGDTWIPLGFGPEGWAATMTMDDKDEIFVLYAGSPGQLSMRKRVGSVPSISGASNVCVGGTATMTNAVSGGTWSSNNATVATVGSSSGIVTGVVNGVAMITYSHGGCYATKPITVNVMPSAGTISGVTAMCTGGSSSLSSTVSGGSWTSNNTAVATVDAGSGVVTGVAGGMATISYSVSNGCATAYATQLVTINATPNAGTITGAGNVVVGSSITLSNAVSGGSWTASNGNVTVGSTGIVTGVTAGNVIISYSVSNSCGTAVATKTVTVNSVAPTITGTLTVCSGTTTALSASIGGGTWSSGNTAVASVGSASGVVTGVAVGTAAIVYTTSTSSATVIVTVTAAPSITGVTTLCPGSTTALSSSATSGTWTGGSTVVATVGSTGVVTGIAAGTTNITYSIGTGCNASITITVNSAPASITGTFKACPGTTTALSCMTTGGTWSSSDPTIAIADAATGIVTGVAAGTITVTYAAGAGCYRTVTVTINPAPAAIGGGLMICTGSSTSLTDVTPGSSWSSSNTSIATISSTGVVAGVGAGNTIITYTAASTNCITTAIVTVNGVPATIGGPATGCTGSNVTLTNSVVGGAWSSSNPAIATVDASTGVVTGVTSGMATITYSGGAGCFKTKAISINNSPMVTGYPMACVGSTTTLSGGSSGTWSSSTPSVASITTSGGYVSGVSAGTSAMTFTSTTTTCPATYVVTVIPTPSAITGATVGCQGSTVTLSNSAAGGSWSTSNTAVATVSAAGVVTAVGSGGTATISYSFGTNCRATTPFSPKPLPAVIGGSTSVCTPMTTTLTCTTGGGTWSSSDASVATVGSAISVGNGVVTGVAAGNANITYTISATGCARAAAITVNTGLNPGTITSSGGFTLHTVSAPTSVTLSSTGASGGTWTSSNPAVTTINASTGAVTAAAAGTTTITYAVTGNCTNIVTKNITVTAGRPAGSVQSTVGSLQLYPNPTTGAFTLVSEEAGVLNVFSVDGRAITSYKITAGINPLNLPRELAPGIYMCRYTSESGSTTIVRLVYERN